MASTKSDLGLYYDTKSKCDSRLQGKGISSSCIDRPAKCRPPLSSSLSCDSQTMASFNADKTNTLRLSDSQTRYNLKNNVPDKANPMDMEIKTKSTDNMHGESGASSPGSSLLHSAPSIGPRKFSEPLIAAAADHARANTVIGSQYGNVRRVPEPLQDYILKSRKFPLKGLHKRYFVLDSGCLTYYKNQTFMTRNRFISQIELANTYITSQTDKRRIDIDASVVIFHLQFVEDSTFKLWQKSLTEHRLYDQYRHTNAARGHNEVNATVEDIRHGSFQTEETISRSHNSIDNIDVTNVANDPGHSHNLLRPQTTTRMSLCAERDASPQITRSFIKLRENKKADQLMQKLLRAFNSLEGEYKSLRLAFETLQHVTSDNLDGESPTRSEFFSPLSFLPSPQSNNTLLRKVSSCSSFQTITTSQQPEHNKIGEQNIGIVVAADNFKDSAVRLTESARQFIHNSNEAFELIRTLSSALVSQHSPSLETHRPLSEPAKHVHRLYRSKHIPATPSDNCNSESEVESTIWSSCTQSNSYEDLLVKIPEILVTSESPSPYMNTARTKLPAVEPERSLFNLFTLLRSNIGRDLSRMRLQANFNEPLSYLQSLCEEMEYSELLDKACNQIDPNERMLYVAAFAITAYAHTAKRSPKKPFTPLQGETFDFVDNVKGWKFMSEQISHTLPTSVCNCTAENWRFDQDKLPKVKFWGKSIEVTPIGNCRLFLAPFNETYTWKKVTTSLRGLFSFSNFYLEHYGVMTLRCSSGVVCTVKFHGPEQKREEDSRKVSAVIHGDKYNEGNVWTLSGRWDQFLVCRNDAAENRCIWRANKLPDDHEIYYGFTKFAMALNEPPDAITIEQGKLPPTDSRFRPDQRLLELGHVEEAEFEKIRVESDHKKRLQLEAVRPMWFSQIANEDQTPGVEPTYSFDPSYWKLKESGAFKTMKFPVLW